MKSQTQTLVLIDGHALLFRAYYAIPMLSAPDGRLVNAVYGFALTLLNVISDLNPTHLAVCFDMEGPTFRKVEFDNYKANRKEAPDELVGQFELAHEFSEAMNLPIFEKKGFEADDMIGTLSAQAKELPGVTTIVVTGDKDTFQLVEDQKVLVFIPGRRGKPSRTFGEGEVEEVLGVRPDQVVDLKGLAGDASDNIPGIKGIGPKTAVGLLREYGTIEQMYEELEQHGGLSGVGKAALEKIKGGKEIALVSKKLATILRDVPITLDLEECKIHGYDKEKTFQLLEELGFKSLVERLPADSFEQEVQEMLF